MAEGGFVDQVRIRVRAGDGGDGAVAFLRTKLQAKGGPNGGDGGDGGSILLHTDSGMSSLAPYARRRTHKAPIGGNGGPHDRHGANGADITLIVPVGTVVREGESGEILADLAKHAASYVVARGGRGGRGNASLKSRQDRIPNYAENGEPGQDRELVLELHLVADVGLLGPPNAGKSTLLAGVSRASPKIADYPFTTIEPGLGVLEHEGSRLTVADLPGLIEGAAQGKGLGLRFLRHAQRCSLLAAVVDLAAEDPVGDLEAVTHEVDTYDPDLADRIRVVVGNKTDLQAADTVAVEAWASERGLRFIPISAAEGTNLGALGSALIEEAAKAKELLGDPETFVVFRPVAEDRILVTREGTGFRVASERVERLVAQTPMGNPRAIRRMQKRLRAMGVETQLRKEGAVEGDDVHIGDRTFELFPEDDYA